ncbi:MAG: two-component sensor histidine kinase [Lachnospiraceae bacterium]|nr:two-component sensor histidine kinase [Lachnospiraceae bacterium]
MRLRLFLILIITGILPVLIFNAVLTRSYLAAEVKLSMSSMETEVMILSNQLRDSGCFEGNVDEVNNALLSQMADNWNGRIRIIDRGLRVIRDTKDRDLGRIFVASEVLTALRGEYYEMYDPDEHILCFVEPVTLMDEEQTVVGAVVVNADTMRVERPIINQYQASWMWLTALFAALFLLDIFLIYYTLRPLKKLVGEIDKASEGNMSGTVSVRNYKETVRISDAVNRVLARARALDETRQEFVSNVAHELKTPITSMRVLADSLMSMGGEAPVELYQEFMSDISSEVDRESKIIDDLLSLSRLDNNAMAMNIAQTNVNEKMALILKRLTPIAQTRDIELLFESFRPVIADIDDPKLTLAITNLVENAIKYNKDGGWVKLSLNADYQYFYIKISDSGCGIPEDALEHIFERFYRVDKARSRATGGTGLGLPIARSIISLHHGDIKAYSKMGEGTTFVVRIPLHYIPEEENKDE